MERIRIYTHSACPWCRTVKRILEDHRVPYQDCNIAIDLPALREWIHKSKQLQVPLIEINGDFIEGYRPDLLKKILGLGC